MAKANLDFIASLDQMMLLELGQIERPGREPESSAGTFGGRNGYELDFLDGWQLALPLPPDETDLRELRRGGTGVELKYQNFSVVMSKSRRMPLLTAVNINGRESRRVPRINKWSYDGRLDKGDQWGDALYANNPLDRGHMVRREDPVWGTIQEADSANEDTFHFTNSCPQMGAMNQKTWLGLENYILENARADGMRVSVFTGPFFTERDLKLPVEDPDTGELEDALIPLSFWKVVVIVKDDGRPSATAYEVTQTKELSELEHVYAGYKTYQISVKQVAERTGLDFSAFVRYDGFSQHEAAGNGLQRERLDSLEMVRV